MRRIAKLLSVAPIAIAIAMVGCDNSQNPISPQTKVTAQYAAKGGPHRVAARLTQGGSKVAVIDANGGTIEVSNNSGVIAKLEIPAGAVKNNTTFTIDIGADFTVDLTATSYHGQSNDVGSVGFRKALTLYISKEAIHASNSNMILGVAELKSNGQLLKVQSSEDALWLTGTLRHFSSYVPTEECCYAPIED